MANRNTYNATTVILILAALIGILSFFCGWFVVGSEFGTMNWSLNGGAMLDGDVKNFFEGNAYIPLYVLILSAIALIIAFLPKMGVNISAPRYSVMLVIVGIAILILTIVYGVGNYNPANIPPFVGLLTSAGGFEFAGIGVWLSLISGIVMVLGGALPALTKKV